MLYMTDNLALKLTVLAAAFSVVATLKLSQCANAAKRLNSSGYGDER
jgi:hypothetical protein